MKSRRVKQHPVLGRIPSRRQVEIEVDGRRITALEGEPVAAALLANKIRIFRYTPRKNQPRGIFCAVGQCTDCAMMVDGIPNVRTCITPVREKMKIQTQIGWGSSSGIFSSPINFPPEDEKVITSCIELAIVGAGPAGLSAAIEAARQGVNVTVLDESSCPGGQLSKQIHKFFGSQEHWAGTRGREIGHQLLKEARELGVEVKLETPVVGIFPEHQLCYVHRNRSYFLKAEAIVLATGASENPLVFPGSTLPGVMGAGATQTMVNLHRVLPGEKVLMVGAGNVGLIIAFQLLQAGARVMAVVEAMSTIGGYGVHASKLRREGIPIFVSHTVKEALGEKEVEGAVVVALDKDGHHYPGTEKFFPVDLICLAVGLSPLVELAVIAGCRCAYLPSLGGYVPLHSEDMETTFQGIYVAGDVAGVEEASTAMEEGRLAGIAAAERLGYLPREYGYLIKEDIRRRLQMLRAGPFDKLRQETKQQIISFYHKYMVKKSCLNAEV